MHIARCLTALAPLVLLASPARAQIEWIKGDLVTSDFRKTTLPFIQGRVTEYVLKGPNLDGTATIEGLGSGVTLVKLVTQFFPAQATIGLHALATAAPGIRTVTLRKAKAPWQTQGDLIDRLEIQVVRDGTFDTSAPTLSSYFTEAGLRVRGSQLNAASVLAEGWPAGTTVTVEPNTAGDFAIVRLRFPSPVAEAAGDLLFHDKSMPSFCRNRPGTYFYKVTGTTGVRKRLRVLGLNAVKSIGFPMGSSYAWGQEVTVRLTFVQPIRAGGETVYWSLTSNQPKPSVLTAQGVAPTTYNPSLQHNQALAPAGATGMDLKLRVCQCLGGSWTVYVNTWFGSSAAIGPGYKQSSFTVSCPAGGTAGCP
jgi:hypothetical protein